MIRLLLATLFFPVFSFSQTIKYRQYKPGEILKYRLTSESYNNGKFSGKTISVSEHKAVADSGFLSEEIRWLSKTAFSPKDTTYLDTIARKVVPYKISLSPKGKVLLPKLTIPEMVGDITDLNTFFVAIAPALNIQKLSLKNPSISSDTVRQGNFADSIRILYGTDCIKVTVHLLSIDNHYVLIRSDFAPPQSFCLHPLLDTISKKVFDEQNNFQMIQKGQDDKVNLFWGVESFSITAKIDRKKGNIIEATMNNVLTLRMRYNASPDLKTYAIEMPMSIKRDIKLELLKE